MIRRFKTAFSNESGISSIEIVVFLTIFMMLSSVLMLIFIGNVNLGSLRSDITRGTGWFRAKESNNNQVFRSDWIVN